MNRKTKRIVPAILCAALVLCSLAFALACRALGRILPSQTAAERWAGEGETAYSQLSCCLAVDEPVTLNQIYAFRYAILDRLHEAGLEADTDTRLFRDAWSVAGKVHATSELGHGDLSVLAVGGDFFHFHQLPLLSGCYLSESDLMQDRVLLDEESAWLLFGGIDLEGMEIKLDGVPFVVSGVVSREDDFASKKAYRDGIGIFMSYDAYRQLKGLDGASCYELVMAEPVKDFALSFVKEKFPIGQGEILVNSGRYGFSRLLGLIGSFGERSMQTHGVLYPYWENAARCTEDWAALCLLLCLLCALFPACLLLFLLIRTARRGWRSLRDKRLPELREKAETAWNKRQRKRWEKKHPGEV